MAMTPSDLPSITGGRSRLVENKKYHETTPDTIKTLIDTTWKSVPSDVKSSRCIGLMDVTMHDKPDSQETHLETHLYVIACSSTGLQDLVTGKNAVFAKKWNPVSIMNSISNEILHLQCIVAPLGPSTQCYCSVPAITAVSEFKTELQVAYWKQIENRMTNRVKILKVKFNVSVLNVDQEKELEELLRLSVYGAKFKSDGLPEEDFKEIVNWHKDLIQNPENYIKSFITDAIKSPEKHMREFCKSNVKIEMLLETATNPHPTDEQEIEKRVEILGLRYLDHQNNIAKLLAGQYNSSTKDPILQLCNYSYCKPKHSRLADYFAQCAEDNATIALMKYLDQNSRKTVNSVDWYSTGWSKDPTAVVHKDLCGACDIRFKDRLEWLLQERERDKEDDTKKPQVSSNIEIKETWNADNTITILVTFKVHAYMVECNMDTAVAAAKGAIGLWRFPDMRRNLLNMLADLVERDRDYLTQLETNDTKKSCPSEYLTNVIRCYRYFAWWASNIHGNAILKKVFGPHLCFTSHEPVGIVGQIISGDSPLLKQAWALGPALSAGNTVVLKPARCSLSVLHVASLIKEAGFPPGVVNIMHGDGDTAAVAKHPNVNKVVFMSSTEVGHQVLQETGANSLKKVTLTHELGFKGSTVIFVFADADLDDAVEKIYFSHYLIFCKHQLIPRIFVEASIYDKFNIKLDEKHKLASYCKRILPLELFPAQRFEYNEINAVITNVHETKYGIAAIYTANVKKATTVARGIRAGTICINCFDAFYAQAPYSRR